RRLSTSSGSAGFQSSQGFAAPSVPAVLSMVLSMVLSIQKRAEIGFNGYRSVTLSLYPSFFLDFE
ncbi:MAG: hypothetical protein RLN92_12520, partial [Alloalcanivorax xenomutans]